jgi:hypothetical protein
LPKNWCILALLPSYLENNHSSLVWMANKLIQQSNHPSSGFFLDDIDALNAMIQANERQQQPTILLGVTYALLDFAEKYPQALQHTIVMETGGMKGRRQEITRTAVHDFLKSSFEVKSIHSEYGMTELLSQAYSSGDGMYSCPPWMKIALREEDDPFNIQTTTTQPFISGAVNIIDLANIHSCAFIATDDAGKIYADGRFEILGRLDHSDIRGCSLLTL